MRAVVLLLLLTAHPGLAGDEPAFDAAEPAAAELSPADRLEEAIRYYQRGEWPRALDQLYAILRDPTAAPGLLQEARIYIGEIYFLTDDPRAKDYFNMVLRDDPQYQIDRFKHPPEVTSYFESLQAQLRPPPPEFEPQVPLKVYLSSPLGIYHFRHGQRAEGWALLASQGTFLVGSGVLFAGLWAQTAPNAATGRRQVGVLANDDDREAQLRALKLTQWAVTAGLFASLIGGGLDAGNHWQIQATAGPTLAGVGVQVPF